MLISLKYNSLNNDKIKYKKYIEKINKTLVNNIVLEYIKYNNKIDVQIDLKLTLNRLFETKIDFGT